jgi:predicted RNA-binding Zn ribbon-like protein
MMEHMEGLATDRLRLLTGRAPGGLALVQELINTGLRPHEGAGKRPADLLGDPEAANRWLTAALSRWAEANRQPAPALSLTATDLAPLRRLRESIRALTDHAAEASGDATRNQGASEGSPSSPSTGMSLMLHIDPEGRVVHTARAGGWRGVAALVTAEILLAQHNGLWPRFKTCPHPACGVAFYDESRSNSRLWHDVRTCGNRTNLAKSRQRRRDAE